MAAPRAHAERAMAEAGGGRTVLVRGLPPSARAADLERELGLVGPVRRAVAVTEPGGGACRGFGFVTFSLPEDARRAVREVRVFGGRRVSVAPAQPRRRAAGPAPRGEAPPPRQKPPPKAKGPPRKARLIVRNLSFQCTEDDLKSVFAPFGTVVEASLPRKADGKLRGFAFLQFRNVLEAAKALKGMNMRKIKERPVAVDWAVAREKYQVVQAAGSAVEKEASKAEPESPGKEEGGRSASPGAGRSDGSFEDHVSLDESEQEPDTSGGSEEEDGGSEEEEGEGGSEEEEESGGSDVSPVQKQRPSSDVAAGQTVFIRNLSFDTEEEELEELLQPFGPLKYVRIVLHPHTERSRGCAFAQFSSQEAAQTCLQEGQRAGLHLGGRQLRIDLAVSREEAQRLRSKKVQKPSGGRNLYLAREGLVRAGTKAAEGVSAADLAKRVRFEELKRQKLKDQNVFVSQTRLCVHNLPKSVDDAALRKLMLQAVGGGPGVRIKECRVMRDRKAMAGKGGGQSLGYAFVEFQAPEHALLALRSVNNNPLLFGEQKRPIVEFSLEDGRKLRLKQLRAERSLQKLRHKQGAGGLVAQEPSPSTSRQGSRQKRKQQTPRAKEQAPPPNGAGAPAGPGTPLSGQASAAESRLRRPAGGSSAWSGFQTGLQEEPDTQKRHKVLPLPSHRGPKIRKREMGRAKGAPPKKETRGKGKEKSQGPASQVPQKKRAGRRQEEVHFEQLVEQYKRKVLGAGWTVPQAKRSKWFEAP